MMKPKSTDIQNMWHQGQLWRVVAWVHSQVTNESLPSKQKQGREAGDRKRMCKGAKLESNDDESQEFALWNRTCKECPLKWWSRHRPDEETQVPLEANTLFRERTTELPQLCLAKTIQKTCERWPSGTRNCKTSWENGKKSLGNKSGSLDKALSVGVAS